MNDDTPAFARTETSAQPCSEACVYFERLDPERWPDHGLCGHPRSAMRGYPVRPGRDCRHYATARVQPDQPASRAA